MVVLFSVLLFSGCSMNSNLLDTALSARSRLLEGNGCEFKAEITADYGQELISFSINCAFDQHGNMQFDVIEPGTIMGISGKIDSDGGALTFDDKVLGFAMLADDQITPVSAPWLMIKSLRSGYIASCGKDGTLFKIQLDDSYNEDPLQLDLWIDQNNTIVRAEFLWRNRRIINLDVMDFKYL